MSNPESEPIITLGFHDGEVLLPRSRTSLYTFLGQAALDHIFLFESQESETRKLGHYLFRDRLGDAGFDAIHAAAREHNFEMHENLPDVPEGDMEAYVSAHSKDIESFEGVPDDWI
jgi:hypothetical protein